MSDVDDWNDPRIPPKVKIHWWEDPRFEPKKPPDEIITLLPDQKPELLPEVTPELVPVLEPEPEPVHQPKSELIPEQIPELNSKTLPEKVPKEISKADKQQHNKIRHVPSGCYIKSNLKCLPLAICLKTLGMDDCWLRELRIKNNRICRKQHYKKPYRRFFMLLSVINLDVQDLKLCIYCLRERWRNGPRKADKNLESVLNSLIIDLEWVKRELDKTNGQCYQVEELIQVYINCRINYNNLKKMYFSENQNEGKKPLSISIDMIASDVDDLRESVRSLYHRWMLRMDDNQHLNIKLLSLMTYLRWLHQDLKCIRATKDQLLKFLNKYKIYRAEYMKLKTKISKDGKTTPTNNYESMYIKFILNRYSNFGIKLILLPIKVESGFFLPY